MMTPESTHLSNDQFTDLVLGGPLAGECEAHLSQCEACRDELTKFKESIGIFNVSSLAWSQQQPARSLRATAGRQAWRAVLTPIAWALAAALLIVVGLPAWNHDHQVLSARGPATAAAPDESAVQIAQDNQLLESVNVALNTNDASPLPEYRLLGSPRSTLRTDSRTR